MTGGSLLVVTGPPGAGKSTVAEVLAARFERSVLVRGDDFFESLRSGAVPPWLPGSDEQNEVVTMAAAAATGRFVAGGYDTVYDGIVGPWYLPTFAAATGVARLDYVMLLPTADRCVEGVTTRLGHGFTDEAATRRMHAEFAAGEIDAGHRLVDPPERPHAVADLILARRAAGFLRWTD